jgi:hypothetical protein
MFVFLIIRTKFLLFITKDPKNQTWKKKGKHLNIPISFGGGGGE